jgi:WD40 repeat protein
MSTQVGDTNVFCMTMNRTADLSAVSLFDGSLKIVSNMGGDTMYDIKDDQMNEAVTSLSWKPIPEDTFNKQKLLGACLDGSIIRWTSNMGNSVEHISLNEENNFHAIDYSEDLRRFCVAGSQPYIEIYDEARMTRVQQIGHRLLKPAHTNKIFTCKFNPHNSNMLYSGGWDRLVRFWDLRANHPNDFMTGQIGGKVSISGDAVDICHNNQYVVTGGGTLGEGV